MKDEAAQTAPSPRLIVQRISDFPDVDDSPAVTKHQELLNLFSDSSRS